MNLAQFAKEVHQNAVDHGFWEGERDITESIALIHSEWSEALEEYRANRPMHYYNLDFRCENCSDHPDMMKEVCEADHCACGRKPEGIAVELIDGCIRILDLFGHYGYRFQCSSIGEMIFKVVYNNLALSKDTKFPTLVFSLHGFTARAGDNAISLENKAKAFGPLEASLALVFYWLSANGIDPEKLMIEKHEYNKGRPYKHGKKI